MKPLGLKRPCKNCGKMFLRKGKHTYFCEECIENIRGKNYDKAEKQVKLR